MVELGFRRGGGWELDGGISALQATIDATNRLNKVHAEEGDAACSFDVGKQRSANGEGEVACFVPSNRRDIFCGHTAIRVDFEVIGIIGNGRSENVRQIDNESIEVLNFNSAFDRDRIGGRDNRRLQPVRAVVLLR